MLRTCTAIAVILSLAGCGGDASPGGAGANGGTGALSGGSGGGTAEGGSAGAAGAWENPGCATPGVVPTQPVAHLDVSVDLVDYAQEVYDVREKIVVRPESGGSAVTLFGSGLLLGQASHGYAYDGQRATFCVSPFDAGSEVTLDVSYRVSIEHQALGPDNIYGIHHWTEGSPHLVVGAYSAPFLTSTWLLTPQSASWIDPQHDNNTSVDSVNLSIHVPGADWSVVGPGQPSVDGDTWRFAASGRMPLNTLSFAASPSYVAVGPVSSQGPKLSAAVLPGSEAAATEHLNAARDGVKWMHAHVGQYDWPTALHFAEIPGYPGGFEHTSGIWLGSVTLTPSQRIVSIHEAVHHWWGNKVRIADWPHFWLSEGFTEWTTVFAILEALDPQQAKARQAKYRADAASMSYPSAGPLRFADESSFIDQLNQNGLFFYRYGAAFLEMVNQRLKREYATDLVQILAAWYADQRGQAVTTEQFRDFLSAKTGDSTTWQALFEQWVYQSPVPTLTLSEYSYAAGQLAFSVERTGGNQALETIEVVIPGNPPAQTQVPLPAGVNQAAVVMPAASPPAGIVIDPTGLYVLRLQTAASWTGPQVTHALP